MSRIYYRGTRAALVCWDLANAQSFAKARFWVQELVATSPEALLYLVGCKGRSVLCALLGVFLSGSLDAASADQGDAARADEVVQSYAAEVGAKVCCLYLHCLGLRPRRLFSAAL